MARLLLVNGPPGVGKSTVARRYLDDHPLALLVEIDALRVSMGRWSEHDESKLHARALALALARTHLGAGFDVVLPQYLGRREPVDALSAVAAEVGAELVHLVLADERDAVVQRFRARRDDLVARGSAHPQADLADDEVDAAVADAERRLADLAAGDRSIVVVHLAAGDPLHRLRSSSG